LVALVVSADAAPPWERLGQAARHGAVSRWVVAAFFGYLGALDVTFLVLSTVFGVDGPGDVRPLVPFSVAFSAAMVALGVALRARAKSELKRKGLGLADTHRVMFSIPPSRVSFWNRPHIAAILAPVARTEATRSEGTPHDQLQSILRHADEMAGPFRPLGAEAAVAARQLIASIEQVDRDVAELARNLEPGEEQRLADKIEALAPVPGRDDEYAPMRQLLEKQLELIRGLAARIEEARQNRNRQVEMLKTLALHLASLRARSVETPSEVRSLSDRVRALCDDIGNQAQALAEASATRDGEDATRTRH